MIHQRFFYRMGEHIDKWPALKQQARENNMANFARPTRKLGLGVFMQVEASARALFTNLYQGIAQPVNPRVG